MCSFVQAAILEEELEEATMFIIKDMQFFKTKYALSLDQ